MNAKLFTVFYEYNGGTYVRQIEAKTPTDSLKKSLPTLVPILQLTQEDMEEALAGHNIVLLNECRNVWSTTGLINDLLLLIHIVETAASSPESLQDYSFDE